MLTSLIQTFKEGQHASICGQSAPTNQVGCPRDESHTGFFVYAKSDYTLWFKNQSGSWVQHQQISSVDPTARTFHWSTNAAFYLQATEPAQPFYAKGNSGALLVDSTPADSEDKVDALILSPDVSLKIFGSSDTITQTETSHVISDAAPVTIETSNEGTIQIIEDTSDYADSLSSKLAAYYNFDDETSNDLTIGENHGTPSADCSYVDGKSGLGKAIHQTTADAHVSLNNADLMNLGPDFTVSAWIYVPSVQSATDAVDNPYNDIAIFTNIDSYGDWTYLDGFILAVPKPGYAGGWGLPSNCLALYSGIGQGNGIYSWAYYAVASPQDSFPFDEWVHVALTFSGSDQANWGGNEKLFINGQLQSLTPRTNQPAQNAMEWTSDPLNVLLGASLRTNHPKPLAGSGELMYDEVAIWKRELSESEISDLYNEGNGVQLDTTYVESEIVREDFAITTTISVEAPEGTEETNIKVRITK
tara:strand:+ start:5285 stop:6706 length:1422 start_codon:yes stop_codon:yes gene_type:complete